jgi:hypothetical protein
MSGTKEASIEDTNHTMKLDANIALLHECEKSSPSKSMHTHPEIV